MESENVNSINMKNILITGGAGFIGSHLTRRLLKKGYCLKVIDDLSSGTKDNLKDVLEKVEFIEADIRDAKLMQDYCKGIDGIIHLAALSSVALSVDEPVQCNEINVDATLSLLETARKEKVKRVVFASSSAVYGNPEKDARAKETDKTAPLTPYAISKLIGEMYCNVYAEIYGMPTISLRLFNVYGIRQNPKSEYSAVIPKFIDRIKHDNQPVIYGDGCQTRDFVYINDVVSAFELALTSQKSGVYNIASGSSYSINYLVKLLNEYLSENIEPNYAPPRYGEVRNSKADIHLAQEELNYSPQYSLSEGIKDKLTQLNIPIKV